MRRFEAPTHRRHEDCRDRVKLGDLTIGRLLDAKWRQRAVNQIWVLKNFPFPQVRLSFTDFSFFKLADDCGEGRVPAGICVPHYF